jgi:hypothetical protein
MRANLAMVWRMVRSYNLKRSQGAQRSESFGISLRD